MQDSNLLSAAATASSFPKRLHSCTCVGQFSAGVGASNKKCVLTPAWLQEAWASFTGTNSTQTTLVPAETAAFLLLLFLKMKQEKKYFITSQTNILLLL